MYGLKSLFNLRVESFKKTEKGLQSLGVVWDKISRREFEFELEKRIKAGKEQKVEICYAPPAKFQFNVIYVRADGRAAYVYVLTE